MKTKHTKNKKTLEKQQQNHENRAIIWAGGRGVADGSGGGGRHCRYKPNS